MRSDNNVVAPDGPPLVMTNGELNSWKAFTRFVIVLKKMTNSEKIAKNACEK